MKFKDYYTVIGLTRDAAPDDIKQAYRRLARKYHPDVSIEQNAEARFKELAQAYEVLSSPEKRAEYDQQLGTHRKAAQGCSPTPEWSASQKFSRPVFDEGHTFDPSAFLSRYYAEWVAGWGIAWAMMRAAGPARR
ncbi:MAG: DnaJ domain-containing protein [Polaromonas sp.]